MAGPITWRTVNGPSLAEASRPLEGAQRALSTAFTGLDGALKQWDAGQKDIWKQQDAAATQDALGQIYRAKTVEEFNALQNSGALDQATAANGAVIDRAAVNALRDGRVSTLQNRDVQAITYRDTMLDDAQAGDVRRINTLALTDPSAASAELAKNPDLRKSFEIAKNIDSRANTLEERQRARDRFGFDQNEDQRKAAEERQRELLRPIAVQQAQDGLLNGPSARAAQAAQINLANAQAGALASKAEEEAAARQAAVDRKILSTALQDNPYAGGVLTPGSAETLAKLANETKLGSGGSPEKLAKTMERLTKIANEGMEVQVEGADGKTISKKIPVPLELAKAALLGSSDTLWSWNEGYADTFENTIKKRMGIVKPALQAPVGRGGVSSAFPALQNKAPPAINPYAKGYEDYLKIIDAGASVPASKKK